MMSLSLSLSLTQTRDSEYVVTVSAQKYIHFEVIKFDHINQPYVPNEEDMFNILSASEV